MSDPRGPFQDGNVTTSEPPQPPVAAEPEPEVRVHPGPEIRVEPEGVTVPPDEADTVELARSDLEAAARAAGVEIQPDAEPANAAPVDPAQPAEGDAEPGEPDPAVLDLPAGTPIDPRIRERRVAVTRAEGRRRLRILLSIVAVFSAVGIAWLVVQSPFLAVDTVSVKGTDHQAPEAVRLAAGVSDGDALVFVDTGSVADRVEKLPWVATAKVVREFPNDLTITITERLPMAWVRRPAPPGSPRGTAGPVAIVDETGRILGDEPAPPIGIPELVGTERLGAPGTRIAPAGPAGAVARIPRALLRQVGSLAVKDDAAELELATPPGGVEPAATRVKLGRLVDVTAKGAAALAVLDQLAAEGTHVAYIDVRVPGAPATR